MLSSRFLALSFLYLFHAAGLVAADPRNQLGLGNQSCEVVRTVTIVQTVTHTPPPAKSPPPKNTSTPPPSVTQRPGKVNTGNGGNNGNNNNGNNGTKNGNNNNGNKQSSSVSSSSSLPVTTSNRSLVASPSSTASPPSSTNSGNTDTSLTLDPSVIQNINAQGQGAGQTDSLVSPNNFINFCVGKTLTNGKQVKTGSCNPTPMGDIPSIDNMPSAKFNSPKNFDTIPANTPFDIALQVNNLATGTFTNAANTYFAAPQQLVNGIPKGHSHITVQKMESLDSTQPLDPKVFAFFKGVNSVANNGILTASVTNGLPAGFYRISSIGAAANHQELVGPVAQRGSFNDVIYVTVSDGGQNAQDAPPSSTTTNNSTSSTVPSNSGSSSILSSSLSSQPVPSSSDSSNGGGKTGGKNTDPTPTDSLQVSSSTPPTVSPTPPLQTPDGNGGNNGIGKNNGGNSDSSSSSEPPAPSSTDGKGNGKQGDPTSSTPPATSSSSTGNDKSDTTQPTGGPANDNGSNSKRMQRRSRFA